MLRHALALTASLLLAACASAPMAPPAAVSDLAPTGKLRAVINYGNPILAKKDAATTAYTGPYVQIEGAYLVKNDSPIRANEEVDREGVRVAVGNKSAYDLYLARNLRKAKIERAPTSPAVVDYFLANKLEFVAQALQRHRIEGASIAPPGGAP